MQDPHDILGVSRDADEAEIKAAYRRLAKQYHPDIHPGDAVTLEKFRDVCAAYELLIQDFRADREGGKASRARRQRAHFGYRQRQEYTAEHSRSSQPKWQKTSFTRDAPDSPAAAGQEKRSAEDVFSDLFSGLKSAGKKAFSKTRKPGAYRLDLDFIEAALGTTKRLKLPDGKRIDVRIPGGIMDGQQIRLRNQATGLSAQDDPPMVTIYVRPHPFFTRHGSNIHLELPVRVDEAVLGAKINVPTIDGPVLFTLPEGSNAHSVFRLKGKGTVVRGKTLANGTPMRGDQYISLKIILPGPSDTAFTKLIRRWQPSPQYSVRDHLNTEVTSA